MVDLNKLKTAKDWMEKLANGINPLTSEPVKEDDIVNNVHISRCLFFVREMLEKIEPSETVPTRIRRKPFWMTVSEAEKIVISDSCGIVQFTRIVNEAIPAGMRPLSVATVIKWLRNNGYLYEAEKDDKHITNLPTEKGIKLGITVKTQLNFEGKEFQKVFYDVSAQRVMLSNIESIALSK
ncbi:MAG: hypothetical protein J5676_12165 [Bacteroidaceae bacterium]|nr:hypothetical protein [Bacteroidaceae bacterium]